MIKNTSRNKKITKKLPLKKTVKKIVTKINKNDLIKDGYAIIPSDDGYNLTPYKKLKQDLDCYFKNFIDNDINNISDNDLYQLQNNITIIYANEKINANGSFKRSGDVNWDNLTKPLNKIERNIDSNLYNFEIKYILICFKDAISKGKASLDKFLEIYFKTFRYITLIPPIKNYRRDAVKSICNSIVTDINAPVYCDILKLAIALRGALVPNVGLDFQDLYYKLPENTGHIKEIWKNGSDRDLFQEICKFSYNLTTNLENFTDNIIKKNTKEDVKMFNENKEDMIDRSVINKNVINKNLINKNDLIHKLNLVLSELQNTKDINEFLDKYHGSNLSSLLFKNYNPEIKPLTSKIKRDGQDVTNINEKNVRYLTDMESTIKQVEDPLEINKILAEIRDRTGQKYENPPISRGGVSVKDLKEQAHKDEISKTQILNSIQDIAEHFNTCSANGLDESKNEDIKNESSVKTWNSDPVWFNTWTAESVPQPGPTDVDNKKECIERVEEYEQNLANAYVTFLSARREFYKLKNILNYHYKLTGIEELKDELK